MVRITLGTAGWDYKDWVGHFYPVKLEKTQYLTYFSQYFNVVEINSTFYNLPSVNMVINWYNRVPQNFRFIIKVWQKITHELNNSEVYNRILEFFSRIRPLQGKTFGCLLQFPSWFKSSEKHLEQLKFLIKTLPPAYKYIIELRDNSWFNPEILSNFIDGKNFILGTTYMPNIIPYYIQNQLFYYIRLIGDRELTVFNRIQREQKGALNHLYLNIQDLMNKSNIYEIFIIVNNHFQGFAPEAVNEIKKRFGIPFRKFSNQKSLIDFF